MFEIDDDGVILGIQPTFIRTPYNYDRNAASVSSGLRCTHPSMAKQEFVEECDINTIVRRFHVTGELPGSLITPFNADFAEAMDYHDSLNRMLAAEQTFMTVPAEIRARFKNNPGFFVDFVSNPDNLVEIRKMGLAAPERGLPVPIDVRVIPTPSDEAKSAPTA